MNSSHSSEFRPDRFEVEFTKVPRQCFTEAQQRSLKALIVEAAIPASIHIWQLGVLLDHPATFDSFCKWHREWDFQEINRYKPQDDYVGEAVLSLYNSQSALIHQYKVTGIKVQAVHDIFLYKGAGSSIDGSSTIFHVQLWFSNTTPVPVEG